VSDAIKLPSVADIVIVGGGIVGVSVAYHLAKLGRRDIVLFEQGQLTCGTTWHAAGLVGQMRPNRSMTRMSRYGIELYSTLEAETGLSTGWRPVGSVNVARTPERWLVYQRQAAMAKSFGIEVELISPAEAGAKWPVMRTDDLLGALWFPADGKANPTDLTMSLAKGARNLGVTIVQGVEVNGITIANGAVAGVSTTAGEVRCRVLANCTGQWAREFGRLAGVAVPLASAEHFYIVTEPIKGLTPDTPVMRDPDGLIYFKEEVGGLVMGGFEPKAKPWGLAGIPKPFEFQLLPEDWNHFEILMNNAIHRVPALETTGVKMLLNGPESFTPDGNFILGEAPEVKNYFVAAGFNSAGIANAGGAGKLLAEWIVGGEAPMDLFEVDIRRFGAYAANRDWLRARTVETLGLHYVMRWPRHELESGRPLRMSPLYERLKARGACFGSKMGWERANWFARPGEKPEMQYTFGRPNWLDAVIEEQLAVRERVGLFDQTSFGKILLSGGGAHALLQKLCANDIGCSPGEITYTAMLNDKGGFESDVTIQCLDDGTYLVVTGSAQPVRDLAWIKRHQDGEVCQANDVTPMWSVLSLMGPKAEAVLQALAPRDYSPAAFPMNTFQDVSLGGATVRAARVSYVGGPGWELYVPVEMCVGVYDALHAAGGAHGLKDCGYYALDALRIEAGRRAFGAELSPDVNPYEAGLGFAVRLEKEDTFLGQKALREFRARQTAGALQQRLLSFVFPETANFAWGGEPILRDGRPVGELSSVGYSATLRAMVGLGCVRSPSPERAEQVLASRYEIEVSGTIVPARASAEPAWPPAQ
jgi:glycine cleavage system aminomethyltransferase T/glycine/D-amino acid oxidase-like deaminating enzyme